MPRLSIFCLTSFLCLAPIAASSAAGPWRANPLRPPTNLSNSSTLPAADGTPRIQIQQPIRNESADVEDRNPYRDMREGDTNDRDAEAREWASEQTAAPRTEGPAPSPAMGREGRDHAVPPTSPRAAEPAALQQSSTPQTKIGRLPSVFAPPPLASSDVSGLQLREAQARVAPAALPAATAPSTAADRRYRPVASPQQQRAVIGSAVPRSEPPAEKPPSLWQRFVRFPKPFKKPSPDTPTGDPLQILAKHTEAAEPEPEASKRGWFGGLMKAPPPPQWMQDRMANRNLPAAGDE